MCCSRPGQPRVTIPFSPNFLTQLDNGNVKSISSRGDTIQGTFVAKVKYPADDKNATPTTLFSTEVPTFWNNTELTQAAAVRARPGQRQVDLNTETSLLAEILLGFGPTLLLVGLFVLFARRAAAGGGHGRARQFRPVAGPSR